MSSNVGYVTIENAEILFRNFEGREGKFNTAGNRNFSVIIEDKDLAERLSAEGWNVRILKPRNEDDEPRYYMQVVVKYGARPPKITLITGNKREELDEETVECLDYLDIRSVDLTVRPYNWEMGGQTGIKAYLKNMYVTVEEDVLDRKYDREELPFDE